MARDHSRLGLENKFLEIKSGIFFFAFDKFTCQQIWECVNQPFILLYIKSEEKQYYLSYKPLQNAVFYNFSRQIALRQYSGRSIVGF